MKLIRVVSVIVDTKQVTLYKEDGNTVVIPQGDPRVAPIINEALPLIQAGKVAEIDIEQANAYRDFEAKSTGISFWRVAKTKIAKFFNPDPTPMPVHDELELTDVVDTENSLKEAIEIPAPDTSNLTHDEAIADIMKHAEPVTSPDYIDGPVAASDTIVAKVGNRIVPGVEKLEGQFAHAAKLGSTVGVERFLARLAAVIDKRAHSVEDVLRFMEKGDLPIADDGSIIAYKILRKKGGEGNIFVDCHTGRVPQQVGSFVCVDESLVDRNRRNECSNGLHIARRGYLGSFPGDVCVLTKIAPEDVVTVPHGDPNKVRVCGYHLLFVLSDREFATLKKNKPMTAETEAQGLLAQAIRGDHIRKTERVQICGQHGSDIKITPIDEDGNVVTEPQRDLKAATALDDPENVTQSPTFNPNEVDKKLKPTPTKPAPKPIVSMGSARVERARQFLDIISSSKDPKHRRGAAVKLMELKKNTKVGWPTLGVSDEEKVTVLLLIQEEEAQPIVSKEILETVPTVDDFVAPPAEPTTSFDAPPAGKYDRAAHARNLGLVAQNRNNPSSKRLEALQALMVLKGKSKVSWERLGYSKDEIAKLETEIDKARQAELSSQLKQVTKQTKVEAKKTKATVAKKAQQNERKAAEAARDVRGTLRDAPPEEFKPTGNIRKDNARKLFNEGDFAGLKTFKARAKVSWERLGFSEDEIGLILG